MVGFFGSGSWVLLWGTELSVFLCRSQLFFNYYICIKKTVIDNFTNDNTYFQNRVVTLINTHFCKRKTIEKKYSEVLSEDALTTWYSLTLSQQPWEGYPKQPAKNSMWLTNHGHCSGV